MKTKTLILTLLTVALLLPAVALPVSAEFSVYGSYLGLGDLDNNHKVNSTDYAILKRYVMRLYDLPEELVCSADITLDGKVNALDYVMLRRMVLKIYQPDRSWLGKPVEELTDEELWKRIRYDLARYRVEGELIVTFREGMDAEAISEVLASVGLSPDLKNPHQYTYVDIFHPDFCWLTLKTEEALLPEVYFALSRCDAVKSVYVNAVSFLD
jgi:hypothetical protein